MTGQATVVLDVGKTASKLSLWSTDGVQLARRTRANEPREHNGHHVLDVFAIEDWAVETLREFAGMSPIGAIIPVGHGAAAAVVRDGKLAFAPLDYECTLPGPVAEAYSLLRDSFERTGSPRLPAGLNLGAQLFFAQQVYPEAFTAGSTIMTWPQYWAYRMCGTAATEVSSLGCHTDLWDPHTRQYSSMARRTGLASLFAPLRHAGDVLGRLTGAWQERTGITGDVQVYCGLHDSNAALLAARGFPEIAEGDASILTTGTWFVAMRSASSVSAFFELAMSERRDCLVNVDVAGNPVPSARFMGGREIELLTKQDVHRLDDKTQQRALIEKLPAAIALDSMVLPSFVTDSGPFPQRCGQWVNEPEDSDVRRAAIALYAALMSDTLLNQIGSRNRLVVEGRFAEADVIVRILAGLRPSQQIFTSHAHNDVSFGALRLVNPRLEPADPLFGVAAVAMDLSDYRSRWRKRIA